MLNETQVGETWLLFADYIDKKQADIVAERYVEFLVDQGINDRTLHHSIGVDPILDQAITYYLEEDIADDHEESEF